MKTLFALLCLVFVTVLSQDPGFKSILSVRGINYAKDVGMEILRRNIDTMKIPDQQTRQMNTDIFLTNFAFQVRFPAVQIQNIPNQGVRVVALNLALGTTFNWRFKRSKFPPISGSGGGNCGVENTNIVMGIQIKNNNGRYHVSLIENGFHIGKLNVKINGGILGWILNIIVQLFNGSIKGLIENEVRKIVLSLVNNNLNQFLNTIPTSVNLGPIGLDYGLPMDPSFTPSHLTIPTKGEFFNPSQRTPSRYRPSPTPELLRPDRMGQFILTDFMPLTFAEQVHTRGMLNFLLEDKHLPEWSPVRLTVQNFVGLLPALGQRFPQHNLKIQLKTSDIPVINFLSDGLLVVFPVELTWIAFKDGQEHVAFVTKCIVSTKAIASIAQMKLIPKLLFLKQENSLVSSNIGHFNPGVLDNYMNILYDRGFIPLANAILAPGVPLPSPNNVEIQNPEIFWGNRFLGVAVDIRYTGI